MYKLTLLFFTALLMQTSIVSAQDITSSDNYDPPRPNIVKWNVAGIPIGNFSFQYERPITSNMTVAAGVRFMPKGDLPFQSIFENIIDNDEIWSHISQLQTGNVAFTPEFRFYFGRNLFEGFYVAPFVRIARYSADVPIHIEYRDAQSDFYLEETVDMTGGISTFTGGVLFGAQWKLADQWYLDWWILGPQYGTSKGDLSTLRDLSEQEQDALREQLSVLEDVPLIDLSSEVNSEGATIHAKGPWTGLRTGLAVGYRF